MTDSEGRPMPLHATATIPATEVFTLASKKSRQNYRISMALPASYESKPRQKFAAIYLPDANWYFATVTELTRQMALCKHIPETIIVGIGYVLSERLDVAFTEMQVHRYRDLTPVVDRAEEQG